MNLETIPVLVGLPLALLAGGYAIYHAVRLGLAIARGGPSRPPAPTTDKPGKRITARPYTMSNFDNELQAAHTRLEGRKQRVSVAKRK